VEFVVRKPIIIHYSVSSHQKVTLMEERGEVRSGKKISYARRDVDEIENYN
jgi:hypothetical protein